MLFVFVFDKVKVPSQVLKVFSVFHSTSYKNNSFLFRNSNRFFFMLAVLESMWYLLGRKVQLGCQYTRTDFRRHLLWDLINTNSRSSSFWKIWSQMVFWWFCILFHSSDSSHSNSSKLWRCSIDHLKSFARTFRSM